ncbi:MAG: hypothetical protein AB1324_04325 [Candidatus Micrarchaeota archaeon]
MAQPSSLQAPVERQTLTSAQAQRALSNPVTLRRGEVQSITLTIPLLSDRNSYLVVRLPDESVRALMSHLGTLPQDQRREFTVEWIMRNQQAVLDQYVRSGGSERRFRYDVVPIQAQPPILSSTPRRVDEQRPPARETVPRREESPHRLVEQRHYYDDGRDRAPQGWRAPRANELPQEVRTRANELQPRNRRGQMPMGDGRIEEYNGRRYLYLACYHTTPAPRHASVSVFVQAEQRAEDRAREPTPVPGPVRAEEPAPVGQMRRRGAQQETPTRQPIPPTLGGGSGTERSPFVVNIPVISRGGERGSEITTQNFFYVIGSDRVYFRLRFTVSEPVPAEEPQSTRLEPLTRAVMSLVRRRIRQQLPDVSPNESSLYRPISGRIREASGNAAVGRYVLP